MEDTDDVSQILVLKSGVVQSHPAGVSTWLSGFLCRFHD